MLKRFQFQNAAMKHFPVAVIIEKTRLDNRWVSERWEAIGVIPAFAADPVNFAPRRIVAEVDRGGQFLTGHFRLKLFRDEVDNYHLNLTSPEPRVFVMWRMEEDIPRPVSVTLSYGGKGRKVYSRERINARELAAKLKCPFTDDLSEISQEN